MLFSAPKAVLWPRSQTVDLYLDRSENNIFTADINLWKACTEADLKSFSLLLAENKITSATILIPDDVVFTKSFIYDSEITSIDKNEVIGLAESFINFKIHPEYIDYELIPAQGKTIIKSHIFDRTKITALESNLKALNLKSFVFESVSQSIARLIAQKFTEEYFLIFPTGDTEYTLLLARGDSVYLTSTLKGQELEVQKTVNYSKLYFPAPTTKFFVPADKELNIIATSNLDKTPYNQTALAAEAKKPTNLPLPVLGIVLTKAAVPAIINQNDTSSPPSTKMENKKNILPFIAVFVITAALASVIIWFVLNKGDSTTETPLISEITPTESVSDIPTEAPTPTLPEIDKAMKIQVLNATEISGQAATLKEKLTNLGFTAVTIGNSKDKLTANQIKFKATTGAASAYFAQELAGFFDATATTDLSASSTYDAVFYIGTDLGGGSNVTASPTTKAATSPTIKPSGTVTPTLKPSASPTP